MSRWFQDVEAPYDHWSESLAAATDSGWDWDEGDDA